MTHATAAETHSSVAAAVHSPWRFDAAIAAIALGSMAYEYWSVSPFLSWCYCFLLRFVSARAPVGAMGVLPLAGTQAHAPIIGAFVTHSL